MKSKVLFVIHYPPPIHGASFMGKLIKDSQLIKRKYDCKFIRLSTKPISNKEFLVIKLYNFTKIIIKTIYFNYKLKPDLIFVTPNLSGWAFYKDFIVSVIAKVLNKNVIYHFQNKGLSKNKYVPEIIKKYFLRKTNVILLSEKLTYDINEYVYRTNIFICNNAIIERNNSYQNKAIKNNKPINLMFLSNMIESKGVYDLLEICSLLKNKNIDFICNFYGPWYDIDEKSFKLKVELLHLSNLVNYHGPVYDFDKVKAFQKNDIFVFPTYYHNEAFPLVILEAMSYGLPVITTNEGGIGDIIKDYVNGFVSETRDINSLAMNTEILIKNKELRYKIGINNKFEFKNKYTDKVFEKKLSKIIEEVIN